MKIVKLDKKHLQEWRENRAHLVDDEGRLVRELERPVADALATLGRAARSQRKSLQQKVAIGSGATVREHLLSVLVERAGTFDTDVVLTTRVDGHRVVSGREVIAAKMLHAHGECQLRGPNNVVIKVVRDPGIHRPTFKESQQVAPRPEHCSCKTWGRSHPGTHFSTCPWNRLAPPEERAPSDAVPEEELRVLPTEAFESLRPRAPITPQTHPIAAKVDPRAVVMEAAPLDPPSTCRNACLAWATPNGVPVPDGQHHPTCTFARAWAIKTNRDAIRFLVDLRNGQKVRVATDQEVGEAEITQKKTGQPIITVDSVPYAVLLETEIDREAALDAQLGAASQTTLGGASPSAMEGAAPPPSAFIAGAPEAAAE